MFRKRRTESLHALKESISHFIKEGEIDRPLRLIHDIVESIITEPLCTSQIFGSKDLDAFCQRIGKNNLAFVEQNIQKKSNNIRNHSVFTYIVTKLQKSGGHSRVIEDFIKTRPDAKHILLSTELSGISDVGYFRKSFAELPSVSLELSPKGTFGQRLSWLQKRLLNILPERVFLFNHHQDSVAVAAIQPAMGRDAFFYHHGDHHLCLGLYLSHLKHIDPHPMGYHHCRNKLGIDNIYVPLTVEDKGTRPSDWQFLRNDKLVTCTAARSNKIEIPYFVSYLDVIPQLLKATGGQHLHIGRLSPWALLRIHRGLKRNNVRSDRFVYTSWVPSVWKALHEHNVDLYVASFPYGGGLTLIEAMGAGIPVALHQHIFSNILSGIDLAYPGAFNWRHPEELIKYCTTVTAEDLKGAGNSGRKQYEKYHKSDQLNQFLHNGSHFNLMLDKSSCNFSIDEEERMLWMERQMNLSRMISRAFYRAYRRFRT